MSIRKLALMLAVIAAFAAGAATAHAQNARTWVSATGTDTSNTQCSVTAPCLTFAHAIAETQSGGEIDCLTPGGFGALTINIPVTIDCKDASNGGIQVGSNGTAITINTSGIVNLIGLDINGENASNGAGVVITANPVVNIRNCKIYGFMGTNGDAIVFGPSSTGSGGALVVDNSFIANSGNGIFLTNIGSGSPINVTVRNSSIIGNSDGIQLLAAAHIGVTVEQTLLAFNINYGIDVSGNGAIGLIGGSTVVNNGEGVGGDGIIYSFKNNQIGGNDFDGTPLTAYPGGPLN
jgi:hypothetical protein